MGDIKTVLLRAFGALSRSKSLYRELAEQVDEPALKAWFKMTEERVGEDLHCIQQALWQKFGVSLSQ